MGAGQSTTESPSTSSSLSSPPSSSSPSSSSSTSPFSLSPTSPPSKLCEFSKQQTDEFTKEIELLEYSEHKMRIDAETKLQLTGVFASKMFHLPTSSFDTKYSYLKDPGITHPLLIKRILCLMVIDILKKYKEILEKTNALCDKCRGEEAVDNINNKIDEIMTEFEGGFTFFNLFIENFQKGNFGNDEEYGTMLKNKLVQVTSETNKRFENIERIKTAMKAICMDRQKSQEARSAIYSGKLFGGTRSRSKSRSKSIKRKQKKMKSSSKHFSKTRNHKKIQQ